MWHENLTLRSDVKSLPGPGSGPFESPWSQKSTLSGFSLTVPGPESADTTFSSLDAFPVAGIVDFSTGSPHQRLKRVILAEGQDISASDINAGGKLLLSQASLLPKQPPGGASREETRLTISSILIVTNEEPTLDSSKEVNVTEQSRASSVIQNPSQLVLISTDRQRQAPPSRMSKRRLVKSWFVAGLQSDPLNRLLKKMEETCSYDMREAGYVYYFPVPHKTYVKIGHVRLKEPNSHFSLNLRNAPTKPEEIRKRLEDYKNKCKLDVESLVTYEAVPCAAWRVETLIHQYLSSFNRKENCICRKQHREFLEIPMAMARQAVQTWRAFGECMPYSEDGKIKPFWAAKAKECRTLRRFSEYSVERLVRDLPVICEDAKKFEATGRCKLLAARPVRKFGKKQTW